ncbi:hypothetical protein DPMN_181272 [Dreissena polymorpha]|uniref:Uncharacterized protein n=1 Tax=Dreissena polymorpha TaxID=45954 RepID=A0A9D4DE60_DREPO|nr:hypothetical protein DPMN_181272 [Dreissena polymorpha]
MQDIIKSNVLNKFHEEWITNGPLDIRPFHEDPTMNVASAVLKRQIFMTHKGRQTIEKMSSQKKKCPTPWWPCFSTNQNHFHPRYNNDEPSDKGFTNAIYSHIRKNAPPPGTNLLTKNVPSRVLGRKKAPPPLGGHISLGKSLTNFHEDLTINVASRVLTRKIAPPTGCHVFKATRTFFKLVQDTLGQIFRPNVASRVLTRKNSPPHGGHVFQ